MYVRMLSRGVAQLEFTPNVTLETLGIDLRGSRGPWPDTVSLRTSHFDPVCCSTSSLTSGAKKKLAFCPYPLPGILPPLASSIALTRAESLSLLISLVAGH